MKYCLMVENVWDIVDGTEAEPGDPQRQQEFLKRRKKATAMLVSAIKPELYYLLTSCNDSPHEMWTALRTHLNEILLPIRCS